jgi:uncharacterized membrane protein
MANQSHNVPQQNNPSITHLHQETTEIVFQGPLPAPDVLEKYQSADPSFPERIMKMAEAHNEADVLTKKRISFSNLIVPIIGQISTILLCAGSFLACIYLAKSGYSGAAIAAVIGGLSPIIIGAFKNFGQK